MSAAALLQERGFVLLTELRRDANVTVFQAKKQETGEKVIMKMRVSTSAARGATSINAKQEYEILQHLRSSGASAEPLTWFCTAGFEVLVMTDTTTSGDSLSGFQYVRIPSGGLDLSQFFPLARTPIVRR